MNSPSEIPRKKQLKTARRFMLFALIMLASPGLLLFWPQVPQNVATENRAFTSLPSVPVNWQSYCAFPTHFQLYFDDHFGFRNAFLNTQHRLQYHFWGQPTLNPGEMTNPILNQATAAQLSNDVLIGREGWLFFKGDRVLEDARGLRPYSEKELKDWANAFVQNRQKLAARGISYLVVFTPNKSTVYPEFLPSGIEFSDDQRRLPQLIEQLHTTTQVEVLDLTSPLRQTKTDQRCYHKTDTHWNEVGAYVAFQQILDQLNLSTRRLPLSKTVTFEEQLTGGKDLARMLGLQETLVETSPVLKEHELPTPVAKIVGELTLQTGACNQYENPSNADGLGKVILFHDSFALEWFPWMSEECSDLICCWSFGLDFELIEQKQPNLVIHQIVERMLPVRKYEELDVQNLTLH
ncbi:hypothetical protein Pla110_32350 [Polystyrenella longa]|uniref:AlgX/AlgJ SGNH hydrolase-like domain-containing protein n=1 Tax=Polystyrenella longa TaxID=2528007 RepID=A0A518CQK1_9PLAN|nr:hypothetical protein [Polystyrenella longa]QDU81493.1 hypothetical protein Pla110_32350 [Polystyrenella longa]